MPSPTAEGVRILAVSGSLRIGSHTATILRAAARLLPTDVQLIRYQGLRDVPPYDEDGDRPPGPPTAVQLLRQAIGSADAVLFSTPEYNTSIPGQLKNALDWASRPYPCNVLRGKPVAVVGGSKGIFGAARAQRELRHVLAASGARVIDRELNVSAVHRALSADDQLLDAVHRTRLAEIIVLLAEEAGGRMPSRAA